MFVLVPLLACGAARAARKHLKLTVYAVPVSVQFMNHADDRLRGMSTNPFNVGPASVIDIANPNEKGYGPFPGDDVLYTFHLYGRPTRPKQIGSAIFTCYYNFVKHAICDAYFDLASGVVLASGSIAFNDPRFTLAVTGGTHSYLGALGALSSAPAAGSAQRFDLLLIGLRK